MKQAKIIIGIFWIITLMITCDSRPQTNIELEYFNQEQIDSLKRVECDILLSEMQRTKTDTFGKIGQIPNNFEESLVFLDSMMNPKMKEWIKCLPDQEFAGYVHHGFGMYLRNNWGLWGNSKLADNLYRMGIFHPDDMSGIILDSYQRKLKKEEIKLEDQLKHYQDYWRKKDVPIDSILKELKK